VFHDAQSKADDTATQKNYIEYGRRLEKLIAGIRDSNPVPVAS
jgi:hypothetical protein